MFMETMHAFLRAAIASLHLRSEGAATFLRCHAADLGPGGEIIFEGQQFKSPSAFSVHVKRKQNPGRKADDGWYAQKPIQPPIGII